MLHIKVKKMVSVAQKIKNRIKGKGRGWAFTPKDFLDLGSRNNVGQILHPVCHQVDHAFGAALEDAFGPHQPG